MGLFGKKKPEPPRDPRLEYQDALRDEERVDEIVRSALYSHRFKRKHPQQLATELGAMPLGYRRDWSPLSRQQNQRLASDLALTRVVRGHGNMPVVVLHGIMHFLSGQYLAASDTWQKAEAAEYPPAMVLMAMVRARVPDMWRENMRNLSGSDAIRGFIPRYLAFEERRLTRTDEKLSMHGFVADEVLPFFTYFLDDKWTEGDPAHKEHFEAYATSLAADLRVAGLASRHALYEITVADTRARFTGLPAHITSGGHVVRCETEGENCPHARPDAHLTSDEEVGNALLRYDYWAQWALGSFDFEHGQSGTTGTLLHVFDPYVPETFDGWEQLLRSLPQSTKLQIEDGTTYMSDGQGGLGQLGVHGSLMRLGIMPSPFMQKTPEHYNQVLWLLTVYGGRLLGAGSSAFQLEPYVNPPLPLYAATYDKSTGHHVWARRTPA